MAIGGNVGNGHGHSRPLLFQDHRPRYGPQQQCNWDFTLASGDSAGYSHQTILHHPRLSTFSSLHNAQSFSSSPITLSYLLAGFYSILPIEGKIWPAVS